MVPAAGTAGIGSGKFKLIPIVENPTVSERLYVSGMFVSSSGNSVESETVRVVIGTIETLI